MEATQTKTETNPVKADTDAQAKVKANAKRLADAQENAKAFHAKILVLVKEGTELQADTLDALAGMLGETADTKGRPTESHYLAFSAAIAHRKLSYERRGDLCRKANAKCKDNAKPVAKVTSKARSTKGVQSYEINLPGMLAENVGTE